MEPPQLDAENLCMRFAKTATRSEHPLTTRKEPLVRIRKSLAAIGIVTGATLASTLAFAAWTADGTGTGSAEAITAQAVTATGADASAQLYPGGNGELQVKISNPNQYPVLVTAINNGSSAISADKVGCNAAQSVTFTNSSGEWSVAANSDTTVVLAGKVHMSNAANDACQGATFTVPVSVIAASNAS
jgi:hypothetical protein